MRYWLLGVVIALCVVTAGISQDTKKKEKEPLGKEKDKGKDKDKDKKPPESEITEVLGKTFKEWQKQIHDADPSRRETAITSVLKFGPTKAYDALPDILAELKKHTPNKPVDLSVRVNGIMALSTIFKYKKDPDPKHLKEAIAIYRTFLKDDQIMLKIRTVQGILYLGPTCREALPEVTAMASLPATWEARKEATQVLAIMGFDEKGVPSVAVMQEVAKRVDDQKERSHQVRVAGVHAYRILGMAADANQKSLIAFKLDSVSKSDEDPHVRLAAHLSVMTIEKKITAKHMTPITTMLKHDDPTVRRDAAQALGMLGKEGKGAIKPLMQAIQDPEINVSIAVISALISLDADEVIPVLRSMSKDKQTNEMLRDAAMEALEYFDYRDKMRKEKDKEKDKKTDKK